MSKESKLIPENVVLYEEYKRAFRDALATFGLQQTILDQVKSPHLYDYKVSPWLETTANWASDSLQLPPHLKDFISELYPGRSCYVQRIKMSSDEFDMYIGFENDPEDQKPKPVEETSRLLMFSNGDLSYHRTTTQDGRRQVTVECKPLTVEVMRDIIRLPGLIAEHYLATASFRKEQIVIFERDIWEYMARTGKCPFAI